MTQVSLIDLFLAAFVPGVVTAAIYIFGIYLVVKFKPELAGCGGATTVGWGERFRTAPGKAISRAQIISSMTLRAGLSEGLRSRR